MLPETVHLIAILGGFVGLIFIIGGIGFLSLIGLSAGVELALRAQAKRDAPKLLAQTSPSLRELHRLFGRLISSQDPESIRLRHALWDRTKEVQKSKP